MEHYKEKKNIIKGPKYLLRLIIQGKVEGKMWIGQKCYPGYAISDNGVTLRLKNYFAWQPIEKEFMVLINIMVVIVLTQTRLLEKEEL